MGYAFSSGNADDSIGPEVFFESEMIFMIADKPK